MQRNLETFFPSLPSPARENAWLSPLPPPPPAVPPISSLPPSSNGGSVTTAVVATATSSFAFCGILFFLFHFFYARPRRRRREEEEEEEHAAPTATRPVKSPSSRMQQLRSKVSPRRSVFVDENGLDAVYWREFYGTRCEHCQKERSRSRRREEDEDDSSHGGRIQEKSLLPKGFLDSSSEIFSDRSSFSAQDNLPPLPPPPNRRFLAAQGRVVSSARPASPCPPLPDPGNARPPLPEPGNARPPKSANQNLPPPPGRVTQSQTPQLTQIGTPSPPPQRPPAAPTTPPPPPPPSAKPSDASPPPPLPPVRNATNAAPAPPPPPPLAAKPKPPPPTPPGPTRAPPSAPPPPPGVRQPGAPAPPARPPPAPASAAESGAKKLKPLHWDKVNAINVEHSMVWDKITNGSFKVDEDIMEALFGTAAANRNASNSSGESSASKAYAASQITLLDPRKSQNIAIVLRRTAISRQAILDGLAEGRGISADVLERLTKIALTKEEEDLIRDYAGDPSKLSDAESFLFDVLRAVPAPFSRLDAMLFRSNYEPEVAHLKQSLRTLEQACKELKTPTRGLFHKLLETVLKAGNRMNAGTARGNAQAFNLTALRKLADVKSTDGSTTLLHFVVEEVVRSEGKRLVVNRKHSLRRSDSGASGAKFDRAPSRSAAARAERENEYTMLGLPIVGGLSDEFANLKKAAGIDYDALITACPALQARVAEIKRLVETTGYVGGGGFAREMRTFVEGAEEELRAVRAEQARVLELVKSTTEYYHPGAANARYAHPMQLFMVVKDFLDMVDKACVDIAKNLQKRKQALAVAARSSSSSGKQSESSPAEGSERRRRPVLRFPNLPPRFLSNNSKSDSSSDEEGEG